MTVKKLIKKYQKYIVYIALDPKFFGGKKSAKAEILTYKQIINDLKKICKQQ